ncbi:MAG: glutamine-hydrolyzing carbamoyl-phosphate synthase small subunit [Chlorobi bacterium]|nr:glutamine-hydrolyzing carbamoyl-phosphate synthase small subunit [Chlorobiota bacterium]
MISARLVLENGAVFPGTAIGDVTAEAAGEVIFNTAMSGYQEVMTDPSYKGQIVVFTAPHIGNYGINHWDSESDTLQVEGIVIVEYSRRASNWRSQQTLDEYLRHNHTIGIEGVDTRCLVRILRQQGAMRGLITTSEDPTALLLERVRHIPSMEGCDLCPLVTTATPYEFSPTRSEGDLLDDYPMPAYHVVVVDFGVKRNILRLLAQHGCRVTVVPATTSAEDILSYDPDGVVLSNGPGDPAAVQYGIETARALAESSIPILGICLGHQIIALAFGGTTFKLRFGHHAVNHPIKNLRTGAIEITSQNHGFAVSAENLPVELEVTHINLNDGTVAGLRHRQVPILSVQYHPEAAPGPHDSRYIFGEFLELVAKYARVQHRTGNVPTMIE